MKRIALTGGGTAGHVTPHFALAPYLQERDWEIHYIGTHAGVERELVGDLFPYYPVSAGKLRRYVDLKNLSDPFRVLKGFFDARTHLRRIQPQVVFSKGGFVSVPVAMAAWSLKIPVVLHESDLTPGLANKLSLPFAKELCLTFPASLEHVKNKGVVTGTPIRPELITGSKSAGLEFCKFSDRYRTLLVMGGSLGSAALNQTIRTSLKKLTTNYQIIHLCGKGNVDPTIENPRYCQFEYVNEELPHLMAAADFVLSRAGANTIFELLALAKPHILVPLSRQVSRGDQILNAEFFEKQGFSLVIQEEDLDHNSLRENLAMLESGRDRFVSAMEASEIKEGTKNVLRIIEDVARS